MPRTPAPNVPSSRGAVRSDAGFVTRDLGTGRSAATRDVSRSGVGRAGVGTARPGAGVSLQGTNADGRSGGFTFGYLGNRYSGYIRLGGERGDRTLDGALVYRPDGRRHHDHHGAYYGYPAYYYPYYGTGHYYNHYRPAYYDPYCYWPTYSYASVYYPEPVIYQSYYYDESYPVSSYGVQGTYSTTEVYTEPATVEPAPPAGAAPYDATQGAAYGALATPTPGEVVAPEYEAIDEQEAIPWAQRGADAFAVGKYDDARRLFSQVMLADERDGYAKLLYGLSNFALGEFEVASVAVRRALLTTDFLIERPLDARTLYEDPLMFEGQLERLIRHVTEHKDDGQAKFLLAYLHYSIGRADTAAAMLTDLTASDPSDTLAVKLRNAARTAKPVDRSRE
jgi:hypothetical protein